MKQSNQQAYISCEECGYVAHVIPLSAGTKATCPRCHHALIHQIESPTQQVLAYGFACLIAFMMSLGFPFMSFNAKGLTSEIHLFDAAISMSHFNYDVLSVLTILCVFLLPVAYICTVMFLYFYSDHQFKFMSLASLRMLTWFSRKSKPWLMVDVFLTGVLIALVKILSLAKVGFGPSFWALIIYTLLFVKLMSLVDETYLWDKFKARILTRMPGVEIHRIKDFDECHICSQLSPVNHEQVNYCMRCEAKLKQFNPQKNLQFSWALLLAAVVFYIPANLYPIMYTTSMGNTEVSTIMSGVILLWHYKSYPVAMIIFLVSIIIPIAKIITLCGIYWHAQKQKVHTQAEALKQLKLYRVTEFIGRWSMIDIFVVALLSALVQLGRVMGIEPGMAGVCFGSVVILTMISANLFDPRTLWHLSSDEIEPFSDIKQAQLTAHLNQSNFQTHIEGFHRLPVNKVVTKPVIEHITTIYSASPAISESKPNSFFILMPISRH